MVTRRWASSPIPGARLTCISDQPDAAYSGMLPGVLAGQLSEDEMRLDLARICAASRAEFIVGDVVGLDRKERCILFANRPPLRFDALSIGIGSRDRVGSVHVEGKSLVTVKPMQSFLARLASALSRANSNKHPSALEIAIVGSGVAGIELAFCLPAFLKPQSSPFKLRVFNRGEIARGVGAGLRSRVVRELARRSVELISGTVVGVTPSHVQMESGSEVPADVVIWASGAAAPPLLAKLGLPVDEAGFLATDSTLQTTAGDPILVVGDSGTNVTRPHAKAGVYAVRQAPVLWDNLTSLLKERPLRQFRPQRSFLKLINLGDGRALGEWRGLHFEGRWALGLKHWIDRRFIKQFEV